MIERLVGENRVPIGVFVAGVVCECLTMVVVAGDV